MICKTPASIPTSLKRILFGRKLSIQCWGQLLLHPEQLMLMLIAHVLQLLHD